MIIEQAASTRPCCSPHGFTVSPIASAPVDFGLLAGELLNQSCFHVLPHSVSCVYVSPCAVTIMSEQVPTIIDTSVRQPDDSEAVSSTDDTTGRFIEASCVSV